MHGFEAIKQSAEAKVLHLASAALVGIAGKRPDYLLRALEPMMDKLPAGFYCTNIDTGQILYANRFFLNIVGHESITTLNQALQEDRLHQNQNERNKWKDEITQEGQLLQHRLTLLKHMPDGDPIPVHVDDTAFAVFNHKSHKPQYIVGFIQDATKKVQNEEELQELAYTDGLTGLKNRLYYQERLEAEITQWRKENKPVSIIMLDLDYLKNWNDQFGHAAGDNILHQLSLQAQSLLKTDDIIIRYGGDEILIALPLGEKAAKKVGKRLRKGIESFGKLPEKATLKDGKTMTISVGVASGPDTLTELMLKADTALYRSKDEGRNRVTVYNNSMKIRKIPDGS